MFQPFRPCLHGTTLSWASARRTCFSPGYNIAVLQPFKKPSSQLRHASGLKACNVKVWADAERRPREWNNQNFPRPERPTLDHSCNLLTHLPQKVVHWQIDAEMAPPICLLVLCL